LEELDALVADALSAGEAESLKSPLRQIADLGSRS